MLFRLLKYAFGYIEVALWGYAPERFFNLCNNHEILLWDIVKKNDSYQFKVSLRSFWMLKPLLKKTKTKLRILDKKGLPFFFFHYRKRKILFFSICICIFLLFLCSRHVWKININGNSSVTNDSILQFLGEHGSGYGTKISAIDCAKLEEELRSAYDQIIWTSIKREGTTLTVDIQENLVENMDEQKKPEDFMHQKKNGYDLTALHDGIIESIFVRKGTPLVQKGSIVSKGAVLVSGALPIRSDDGTAAAYQYCTADADIQLKTDYTYQKAFPLEHEVKADTGSTESFYGIQAFGRSFYLPLPKKQMKTYTVTETRKQLKLCGDFYLPFYLLRSNYEEYEIKQAVYTKKGAETKAGQELSEFLEKLTKKGVFILQKHVMIDVGETECTAVGTITVLEQSFRYKKTKRMDEYENPTE